MRVVALQSTWICKHSKESDSIWWSQKASATAYIEGKRKIEQTNKCIEYKNIPISNGIIVTPVLGLASHHCVPFDIVISSCHNGLLAKYTGWFFLFVCAVCLFIFLCVCQWLTNRSFLFHRNDCPRISHTRIDFVVIWMGLMQKPNPLAHKIECCLIACAIINLVFDRVWATKKVEEKKKEQK